MKVPVQPSSSQKKALKAKYKANQKDASSAQKARVDQFKNDPNAASAVRQMTTPQGYSSDPLKPRGGNFPVKKKKKTEYSMRPKYGSL